MTYNQTLRESSPKGGGKGELFESFSFFIYPFFLASKWSNLSRNAKTFAWTLTTEDVQLL